MAQVHTKQAMEVVLHDDPLLALVTRSLPEAASQTFKRVSPVVLTAGLVAEFVAPATALMFGYALSDGNNAAAAITNRTDVVLALPHVEIEANFLAASAADNVFAAADLGTDFDLAVSATLVGGATRGWYIKDAADDEVVRLSGLPPLRIPNIPDLYTTVGDTNARVRAVTLADATVWAAEA